MSLTVLEGADTLARLREPFPVEAVKQRTQGGRQLDYITIDGTINRLLDVLGADWSTTDPQIQVIPLADGKYAVTVSLVLYALGSQHVGVGADVAADLDKAIKTALAEAIKKAGHQLGIGLYLWDEDAREFLAIQRAAANGDVDSMKYLVIHKSRMAQVEQTKDAIAGFYEVSPDDLGDADVIAKLYREQVVGL